MGPDGGGECVQSVGRAGRELGGLMVAREVRGWLVTWVSGYRDIACSWQVSFRLKIWMLHSICSLAFNIWQLLSQAPGSPVALLSGKPACSPPPLRTCQLAFPGAEGVDLWWDGGYSERWSGPTQSDLWMLSGNLWQVSSPLTLHKLSCLGGRGV